MALQSLKQQAQELQDQYYDLLENTDFSIPTFLAFGAVLQILSVAFLPPRVSALAPVVWLVYRLAKAVAGSRDIGRTSFRDIQPGRVTTRMPEEQDGIVVMLLAARINHPFGKLSPGMADVDVVFKDMWRETERNREKWGFLGRTGTLADTWDNEGTINIWITYWRDLKGLNGFAHAAAHRLGWKNFEAGKYPNIGIMHELYHAPKGHYEAIYESFPKWGQAAIRLPTEDKKGMETFTDPLIPNWKGSNMFSRMKKNVARTEKN